MVVICVQKHQGVGQKHQGVSETPKNDNVICEQPLTRKQPTGDMATDKFVSSPLKWTINWMNE